MLMPKRNATFGLGAACGLVSSGWLLLGREVVPVVRYDDCPLLGLLRPPSNHGKRLRHLFRLLTECSLVAAPPGITGSKFTSSEVLRDGIFGIPSSSSDSLPSSCTSSVNLVTLVELFPRKFLFLGNEMLFLSSVKGPG